MQASARNVASWAITLLLLALITTITDGACTESYTNKNIAYIENNKAAPTIFYLGAKSSATQCRDSCIDFNYLCDKSSSNILDDDGASISFNTTSCEITVSRGTGYEGTYAYITITEEQILSSNYTIEVELTQSSGAESGFYWKSNNNGNNYFDYYFGIDPNEKKCITGYADPNVVGYYEHLKSSAPPVSGYNTRYALSVIVSGSTFTTYLDGEQHYSGSFRSSHNAYGWAGIWNEGADTIFHSFKISFPSGGEEEKICAAYLLDSSNRCYGYYGADFTTIETSISSRNDYDSGILYPSDCSSTTTAEPSQPTVRSTDPIVATQSISPSKYPSVSPSQFLSSSTTEITTKPSSALTTHPFKAPSWNPQHDPTDVPTQYPSWTPKYDPTEVTQHPSWNPQTQETADKITSTTDERDGNDVDSKAEINLFNYINRRFVLIIIVVAASSCFILCCAVFIYRHCVEKNKAVAWQISTAVKHKKETTQKNTKVVELRLHSENAQIQTGITRVEVDEKGYNSQVATNSVASFGQSYCGGSTAPFESEVGTIHIVNDMLMEDVIEDMADNQNNVTFGNDPEGEDHESEAIMQGLEVDTIS